MAVEEAKPKAGLEDVVAATSSICYLDGDRGVLAYYGHDIHDLAKGATFEEVCYLLWHGRLPNRAELGDLQSQLAAARPVAEPILRLMKQLPASDGMDMLRTMTSALGQYDPEANDSSPQAQYRKAVRLTAQMGSIVATYGRLQQGGGPIQPDPALSHAANFLYMLKGERPSALATRRDASTRPSQIAVPPLDEIAATAPAIVSRSPVGPVMAPSDCVNGATMTRSFGRRKSASRLAARRTNSMRAFMLWLASTNSA